MGRVRSSIPAGRKAAAGAVLGGLALLAAPAAAQGTGCVQAVAVDHWKGEYFPNTTLDGPPPLVRDDGTQFLQLDWGSSGPSACGIGVDNFSARLTRVLYWNPGVYRFTATADDGIRLLVDGVLKIDRFVEQGPTTYTVDVALTAGNHALEVQYFEKGGSAVTRLSWELLGPLAGPCTTEVAGDRWKGEYFPNTTLAGSPSLVRDEGQGPLGADWGAGGPGACGIGVDRFSARFTRTATFEAATYRFTAVADDGVRVHVDGVLRLDQWRDQAPTSFAFELPLSAGAHEVRVEYYENGGGAVVRLAWERLGAPPSGGGCPAVVPAGHWKGEYFANTTLTGDPAMTRDEGAAGLAYDWGVGSPNASCGLPVDRFSARFTRTVTLAAGVWRFTLIGDDGVRLYVDGALRIDKWFDQGPTTYSVDLGLAAGDHDLSLEYYENGGGAVVRFAQQLLPQGACLQAVPAERWKGEYWDDAAFAGSPSMVRDDGGSGLDFDWGQGSPSPDCGIPVDGFTARYTRRADFPTAGRYRFTITSDDGFRLYVDGVLWLDRWVNQFSTHTVDVPLGAGEHELRVDYYEDRYGAVLKVSWRPLDDPCAVGVPGVSFMRWQGEYFANLDLAGVPSLVRDERTTLAFDWGTASPGPVACGIPPGLFSARFTRTVHLSDALYRLAVTAAGGVRVFVDGALAIDRWLEPPPAPITADVAPGAGRHVLRVEYRESSGAAGLSFAVHRLSGGAKSKLTIQTRFIPNDGRLSKRFVAEARPRLVKMLNEFGPAKAMKAADPDLIIIGRIVHDYQVQSGSPEAAAQSWWSIHGGEILGFPDVDYWEGYNEPLAINAGQMAWLGRFDAERVRILAAHGRKACIGNLGGTPPLDDESWPNFFPAIDEALRHGGIMGLHEYATPLWQYFDEESGEGWLLGRYRKVYRQHLIPAGRVIPLVITETGADIVQPTGWKNHFDGEEYMDQLRWYDNVLKDDDYVIGATIFSLELPGWDSFDVEPILPQLIEHVR